MKKLQWWHRLLIVLGILGIFIIYGKYFQNRNIVDSFRESIGNNKEPFSNPENFECKEDPPTIPNPQAFNEEELKIFYQLSKDITVALRPTYSKAQDYLNYVVSQHFVSKEEKMIAYQKGIEVGKLLEKAQKDIEAIPIPKLRDSLYCCAKYMKVQKILYLTKKNKAVEICRDAIQAGTFNKSIEKEAEKLMQLSKEIERKVPYSIPISLLK